MVLLAGAVSAYSQSYLSMNDYGVVNYELGIIQVFQPQPLANSPVLVSVGGYSGYEEMGQPANSYLIQPGTTVYATGRSSIGVPYLPPFEPFDFALLAANGNSTTSYDQLSLVPASVGSIWYDSVYRDSVNNNFGMWRSGVVLPIPGAPSTASVAIAVWQNNGYAGAATTLAQAQSYGYEWGVSSIETVTLSTDPHNPAFLPTTLTSFSLIPAGPVPEPGTFTLALTGASAFLFRRRK